MNDTKITKAENWNDFWSVEKGKDFANPSWSKKRIINLINPYIGKGKRVLDAGCGSGFFSKYFCDSEAEVYSLDYSDEALEIAKKVTLGKATLLKKDLLNNDLSSDLREKFDLIFTDGLFEHFPKEDQDKIITSFSSVLKDDGVVITFVPNKWSPWQIIRPFYMPGIKETPFVLNELIELNLRNSLKIISNGGINTLPFRFSPDKLLGKCFGMLLYTIAKKIKNNNEGA